MIKLFVQAAHMKIHFAQKMNVDQAIRTIEKNSISVLKLFKDEKAQIYLDKCRLLLTGNKDRSTETIQNDKLLL